MPRWIAFDQKTVTKLRERLPEQPVFEHAAPNVVQYAHGAAETLVAVLPANSDQQAAVAVFRKRVVERAHEPELPPDVDMRPKQPVKEEQKRLVRPGGFLGLRDDPVFEQEAKPKEKKNWWRRFWDEDDED